MGVHGLLVEMRTMKRREFGLVIVALISTAVTSRGEENWIARKWNVDGVTCEAIVI